jgi:DNA-binding NarL/FixJ family response regulator
MHRQGKEALSMSKVDMNKYGRGKKVKIVLVDDHPIVRHGMRRLIADETDLEVCGESSAAAEALSMIESTKPNLVLIDVSLEEGSGLELIKQIKASHPEVRMLVVSMHDESLFADRALSAGAMGYITKQKATTDLIQAIRKVLSGRVYLSERMTSRMLYRLVDKDQPPEDNPIERLSDRELEVFELIGQGVSTRQIAERLHISVKTVETHRENIKKKLDLETNLELIRWAVQWVFEQGQPSTQETGHRPAPPQSAS